MSELSKQALRVENNQQFPNNNAGLIRPSNLRSFNGDMIDSTVNQAEYTADSASFDSRINAISFDTGSLLVTASFNNGTRNMTFTKGDSSTFAVNIPDASGSVLPPGVVSGSSQIILTNTTGNLGGNRITGSVQSAISSSYAVTASFALNAGSLPPGVVSGSSQVVLEDTTFTDGVTDMFLSTDGAGNLSFDWVKTLHQNIHNHEATPILRGTPLFVSGATGDNANVYRADAGNPARRPATLIAFDATLAAGGTGTGIISGEIQGVDTSLYPAGTVVYLGVGGGWTPTRPTGSANSVQSLGVITRSANNGRGVVFNQIGNNLPNIQQGYAWVGDSTGVPVAVSTASWDSHSDLTSLNAFTASQEILNNTFATTGSNNFVGNQDIDGSVTSSISLSNLIANPQTITDNVVVGPDTNGFIVGPTSISGTITVEGDSEVFVFSQPLPPINTGSFATLSSNTFIGNQTITGSLYVSSSLYNPSIIKGQLYVQGGTGILEGSVFQGNLEVLDGAFTLNQSSTAFVNEFRLANDGRLDLNWPSGNYFRMQNGAFQFGTSTALGMFFDAPGVKLKTSSIPQNHAMALSAQPTSFPALNFTQYTGSCAGIIYNQTNSNSSPTYLMVGAKYSSSFDETLYTDLNFFSSGSANISTLKLRQQDPLPAGAVGDLATSGSALYFHDGSSWRTVTLT